MIQPGSRYENSITETVIGPNGHARQIIVDTPPGAYTFSYVSYQVTADDRIDSISADFYGDPTLWWNIANANPEIMDWSVLPVGAIIRIPNI